MGEIVSIVISGSLIIYVVVLFLPKRRRSVEKPSTVNNKEVNKTEGSRDKYINPFLPGGVNYVDKTSKRQEEDANKLISVNPELVSNVVDGEYRVFQNFNINGTQYTFGFPKEGCFDKKVWVGIDQEEYDRVTIEEVKNIISSDKSLRSLNVSQIASSINDRTESPVTPIPEDDLDDLPF
ncbi:hypothetical protein [Roseivirga pacifica]|uniref:hypothetical protein n=1 Tax=Roseivirga pacifica TaxID=1267423 RepID=UPI003BACD059